MLVEKKFISGNYEVMNNIRFNNTKLEKVIYKSEVYPLTDKFEIFKGISIELLDSEEKFNEHLQSDFPLISTLFVEKRPKTYHEYLQMIDEGLKSKCYYSRFLGVEKEYFTTSDLIIKQSHLLQPHEAESYYEASMTLVINGNEVDKYFDGMDRIPPLPFEVPGYIQFEGNYGKIFDIVPEHDRIDFPLLQHENTKVSRTFISKKCIDKALLYKLYKDPATIGTPKSSRAYTGKVEVVELDMHHIDEQVLEVFIQHGVIRKQEPISETEAEQMIAHAKSEAEKSAQDYKEWLLQQQKS